MRKITQLLNQHMIMAGVISISVIFYVFSLLFVHKEINFNYNWVALSVYLESMVIVLMIWLIQHFHSIKIYSKSFFKNNEIDLVLLLLIISVIVNFLFISKYPYVSIADEMRDSGLWAKRILTDPKINIFSYGDYNGYGLISAIFTIPFYFIFGNSVLTYRLLAALLSTLDIPLLYLLIRYTFQNKHIAFWSALTLSLLPLHIFYAHTESLIAFDSFWSIVLFILFSIWFKKRNLINYLLLGTMIGFIANFHTSVRIVAVLLIGLVILVEIMSLIKKENQKKIFNLTGHIAIFIIFCFIGFGPTILFSNAQNFFQIDRYAYSKNAFIMNYTPTSNTFETFHTNYIKSLMVWFYETTNSHYFDHKPIFPPFLTLFFLLGIGYGFFILKKPFVYISLFFIFVLAFTNSAITDWINADHRLVPLFSIGALFVGIGIAYSIQSIKFRVGKVILASVISGYFIWQTSLFFTNRVIDRQYDLKYYLAMNIYYFLQDHKQEFSLSQYEAPSSTSNVCIRISPNNNQILNNNNIAINEQIEYFLSKVNVEFASNSSIKDNEAYITKGNCETSVLPVIAYINSVNCSSGHNLMCPPNYTEQILIYY